MSTKPLNASERDRERPQQQDEEELTWEARNELDAPEGSANASRTSTHDEDGRRTCRTRQNESANARSTGMSRTHLRELQTTQTSRAAKRPDHTMSTGARNAPKATRTSASTEQTRRVQIEHQEAEEASWTNRANRIAKRLSTKPNAMGYIPGARGTRASNPDPGQEVLRASEPSREASRTSKAPNMLAYAVAATETSASSKRTRYVRVRPPRDHLDLQETSRGDEVDWSG